MGAPAVKRNAASRTISGRRGARAIHSSKVPRAPRVCARCRAGRSDWATRPSIVSRSDTKWHAGGLGGELAISLALAQRLFVLAPPRHVERLTARLEGLVIRRRITAFTELFTQTMLPSLRI